MSKQCKNWIMVGEEGFKGACIELESIGAFTVKVVGFKTILVCSDKKGCYWYVCPKSKIQKIREILKEKLSEKKYIEMENLFAMLEENLCIPLNLEHEGEININEEYKEITLYHL